MSVSHTPLTQVDDVVPEAEAIYNQAYYQAAASLINVASCMSHFTHFVPL